MGQDTERPRTAMAAAEWERLVMRLWWIAMIAVVPAGVAAVTLLNLGAWAVAGVYVAAAVCFLLVFRVLLNVLVQLLVLVEAHRSIAAGLTEVREELEAMRHGR